MSMADDGKLEAAQAPPPRQLSALHFILVLAVLTLAAAGVGFLSGQQIVAGSQAPAAGNAAQHAGYLGERQRLESAKLRPLTPIVTNLAEAPPVWIRLEASLVFDEVPADAEALMARISEDIVGFLRTLSLKQIEGATGFQYLSEDLNERVRARSDGAVRELIIQGLIVE
ncbi:MAG: flagellar basal body-associated FliL family protein [Hyphomicrobium sp.]